MTTAAPRPRRRYADLKDAAAALAGVVAWPAPGTLQGAWLLFHANSSMPAYSLDANHLRRR
jgi:hypothetical protein